MLDIGGRQELQQTYTAGRTYQQQKEPLLTNFECPIGSNRKDATVAVSKPFSGSLSQTGCLVQPENPKQTSLFLSEHQLLEQQLCSPPRGVPVCQCLTMTTNSKSYKIRDPANITTSTITSSTLAFSTLVQSQSALQVAPSPISQRQQNDTSFSFLSQKKHSTLKSSIPYLSSSSSLHQTPNQIPQQKKPCFSMSPQSFPLLQQQQQQQHYNFSDNRSSSRKSNTVSADEEFKSRGNTNGRPCSGEVADSAKDLGGANQYAIAYITNKLKNQALKDDAIVSVTNHPDSLQTVKDMQPSNIVPVSPTKLQIYPSSPQKKPEVKTDGGSETWRGNSGQGSDLQATVQGFLGLQLADRQDHSVSTSSHHQVASNSNDINRSAYSGLVPLLSTSSCCSVQTENSTSDKLNDPRVISTIGIATSNDADSFTDMSPGTPPDPPKKKHCRSLSIPSGSSGSRQRKSAAGLGTDSSRCCNSLWKPIAFTPTNEASNPPKFQQQSLFQHNSGQGTLRDIYKTTPFSLSTSPVSLNTGMSASLTSLLQSSPSFGTLFSSTQISGPVSNSQNGSLSLATLVTTPTSVSPSQFQMASSHVPLTMLTSSPPPLILGKSSPKSQTQPSSCIQTPPESPIPRPASVSVVGCRCEDDSDSRAFKPVLDPWLCRSQSRGNSGFSSPSSCSSSSSFLLMTPHTEPRSNAETQSATIGGLLAAPVPQPQTPRSSPNCTPSSLSSPATVAGNISSQAPLQPPYWPFQKHRSFSLEEQLSQMGKTTSTSPSSFFSPSPPSSSSSVLSSPSHYHHHHPYHLPAPVFQTQQYQPSYHSHHPHHQQQQHHLYHHHYQQQQQQQPPQQQPPPPQTVSAGGSTPSVPVACKSSVSNPSSPRRQRIPRCRSQPCVLHDRREGRKRRRDYDRPTLDFHKMTQTAYSVSQSDSSGKSCIKQDQWPGLQQQTGDNAVFWSTPLVTTSTLNAPRISALQPVGPISLEVLRKTDFLASEHGDDPLSEDDEISAATEAGEAAARAAAAATNTKTIAVATSTTTTTTAAIDRTVPAAMVTTAIAMDDENDNWEFSDLSRPALLDQTRNPIGRDISAYVSDESNPSFCGCDDDEEDDDDDDDNMDNDERDSKTTN